MDSNWEVGKYRVIHNVYHLYLGRYECTKNDEKVMFEYHADTIP